MLRPPATWHVSEDEYAAVAVVCQGDVALERALTHEYRWRGRPEYEIRTAQEAAVHRRFTRIARSAYGARARGASDHDRR